MKLASKAISLPQQSAPVTRSHLGVAKYNPQGVEPSIVGCIDGPLGIKLCLPFAGVDAQAVEPSIVGCIDGPLGIQLCLPFAGVDAQAVEASQLHGVLGIPFAGLDAD